MNGGSRIAARIDGLAPPLCGQGVPGLAKGRMAYGESHRMDRDSRGELDLTIRGDTGAREVTKSLANNIGILVADQVEGQPGECAGGERAPPSAVVATAANGVDRTGRPCL